MSIRSGDIRDRSLKLSEIAPNFARFSFQILFERGPLHFWTWIIKLNQRLIMGQSFTAQLSEISRKTRPPGTTGSGGLTNTNL